MSLTIETLTLAHLDAIRLRPEDAREVTPGWKERALQGRTSWAAVDGRGRVVAVWGVVIGDRELGPWLLCSPLVARHTRTLMRKATSLVQWLRGDRHRLSFNHIPKDSPGNRRFVERLGFRIIPSPGPGPDFFYLPHV